LFLHLWGGADEDDGQEGGEVDELMNRLANFYSQHDPAMLDSVDEKVSSPLHPFATPPHGVVAHMSTPYSCNTCAALTLRSPVEAYMWVDMAIKCRHKVLILGRSGIQSLKTWCTGSSVCVDTSVDGYGVELFAQESGHRLWAWRGSLVVVCRCK